MKQYKLLLPYPGYPPVGTIVFKYTEEGYNTADGYFPTNLPVKEVENNSTVWQAVSPQKIDIIKIRQYRDGGTTVWVEAAVENITNLVPNLEKYYLDKRIHSTTKGELFDRYPGDDGAIILDKNKFNFLMD